MKRVNTAGGISVFWGHWQPGWQKPKSRESNHHREKPPKAASDRRTWIRSRAISSKVLFMIDHLLPRSS